jgi:phosphopentomutase
MLPDIFGSGERLDAGTFALAKSYMLANHPRVLYIDLGDPDDFGHAGDYGSYLDAAHYADAMMKDVWTTIQQDPFYKDQTAMLLFPDHGRGLGAQWTDHGEGVGPKGEVKGGEQIYQRQYAQTIAALLGLKFTAEHPVAEGLNLK